jgi:hypothetical protein
MSASYEAWKGLWQNRGQPTHRLYIAPWCGHCRTTMEKLKQRGTKQGVNLHLFIHQTAVADFQKNTESFPDMGKYDAVPAIFDAHGQPLHVSVDSLLGTGPARPASATVSGPVVGLVGALQFRANTISRAADRLRNDKWARRAAVLVAAAFVMNRLGF